MAEKGSDWRSSPEIMAARELAKRFRKRIVVVLLIDEYSCRGASYGQDGRLCKLGGQLLDAAMKAVRAKLDAGGKT